MKPALNTAAIHLPPCSILQVLQPRFPHRSYLVYTLSCLSLDLPQFKAPIRIPVQYDFRVVRQFGCSIRSISFP